MIELDVKPERAIVKSIVNAFGRGSAGRNSLSLGSVQPASRDLRRRAEVIDAAGGYKPASAVILPESMASLNAA